MFDFLLTKEQLPLRQEVRELVRWVPRQMILDMDQDKIRFPREFLREAGRRGLMGVRYPRRWGGRDMDWVATSTVMEEVGTLGYIFGCVFGVGAELVCDAIVLHGTDAQRERYVKPLLRGEIFAAECLTEPRGGSDFFGTSTVAEDRGDHLLLNGQKRFIVGAEAADYFLAYARTDPAAKPRDGISCLIVDRGPGVETGYLYGLMGCRGGGAGRIVFRDVKVPKESKKFAAEACQKVVHNAMQVMGGIGYTDVFPIERIVRDLRLASIWTGTSEVMSLIVASEWYRECRRARADARARDHEADAISADRMDEKDLG